MLKKLPKHIYLHWFIIFSIFAALITALLTYVLVTAPVEHNQRVMVETINYLLTQCRFVEGTETFNILQNISINFTK